MTKLQDSLKNLREVILKKDISSATLYEQLAEECAELIQACVKKSRYLRKENPPRKTIEEIDESLQEEVTDVYLVCLLLNMYLNTDLLEEKANRWAKILEEANH